MSPNYDSYKNFGPEGYPNDGYRQDYLAPCTNYSDNPWHCGHYPQPYPYCQYNDPLSGRIVVPPSRADFAANQRLIDPLTVNYMEGGKNFPNRVAGNVLPPFQTDVPSITPPEDRYIISGGNTDDRNVVNFTDQELSAFTSGRITSWPRIRVNRGQMLTIVWELRENRLTRGYRAFITRDRWNENERITRDQLQFGVMHEDLRPQTPYGAAHNREALQPSLYHDIRLPLNKSGHHVIILIWLVASAPIGIYQAFDVDFGE